MKTPRVRLIYIVLLLIIAVLALLTLRPQPIGVDIAPVQRELLQVTVDEEGETRVHDRFAVAAPVAGSLMRIELHDGDPVEEGQVLATIAPLPLSSREREEQQARVAATEALLRAEEDRLRHAKSDYEQARRESERLQNLLQKSLVSPQAAEQAKNMEITSRNELEAAQHRVEAATFDVKVARAGLIAMEETNDDRRMVEVRSPVKGQVLRVLEKSERVVAPGTPLLTIGNPSQLEVVVDVLSSEAVKVKAGMPVLLENWGGDQPLHAKVRTVEPHAFTKVSALGIEEQRVNIVADLLDAPEELGDGYRVDARIITWEGDDVLVVPASALFRQGASYAVFVIQDGRAKLRAVEVGHRGSFEVEVLKGLSDGDRVVIHPPNELTDGKRVKAQER